MNFAWVDDVFALEKKIKNNKLTVNECLLNFDSEQFLFELWEDSVVEIRDIQSIENWDYPGFTHI